MEKKEARYTEGDIIISNNKFYICEIAGAKIAMFKASYLQGFHNYKANSGCGSVSSHNYTVDITCNDFLYLPVEMCKFTKQHEWSKDKTTLHNYNWTTLEYPIVGKDMGGALNSNTYGIMLDFNLIQKNYPELFEDYITFNLTNITSK
jgi:hypothetical protein